MEDYYNADITAMQYDMLCKIPQQRTVDRLLSGCRGLLNGRIAAARAFFLVNQATVVDSCGERKTSIKPFILVFTIKQTRYEI